MTIIEFLWTVASCLTIALLSHLLYVSIRNDIRYERERFFSRRNKH
nr:MAG TPA: hypothetical protein [Caudoviricetes sp.]